MAEKLFVERNKLISFGCSHTQGVALPDWHGHTHRYSKYAWGEIVSQELNIPTHDNQGHGGASNRHILHNILNYKFVPGKDIVVILWTYTHRRTLWHDNKNHPKIEDWGNWRYNNDPKYHEDSKTRVQHVRPYSYKGPLGRNDDLISEEQKKWYNYFYSVYDTILQLAHCIHHAKLHLDSLGIPNYHMLQSILQISQLKHASDDIPYLLDFPFIHVFFDKYQRIPPLARDNAHAGPNAHKQYGTIVAENIKKCMNEKYQKMSAFPTIAPTHDKRGIRGNFSVNKFTDIHSYYADYGITSDI